MSTYIDGHDGNGSRSNGNGNGYHANGNGNGSNDNGYANGNDRRQIRELFDERDPQDYYNVPESARKGFNLWEWSARPDSAALHGLISCALWLIVGTSLGLLASYELTTPDLFAGIPFLVFSRVRPAHVNTVLLGFLATGWYGAWYYMVPRLCQTQLRSDRYANVFLLIWNLTILVGLGCILGGLNQGKEYCEFPWFIDWIVVVALLWNLSIIFSTIAARREPKMYVSLWYIAGSVVWVPIMYAIGNVIWHPFTTTLPDGQVQYSGALFGLNDAVWNWFYGHNLFGLFITTGGISVAYYMVPKITKRPLYSHAMSLIGFWTIALLYSPTGQHHLLNAPIPNWLKILAIVGSIGLIVPVFTFTTNLFMTMRGAWGLLLTNIPMRFLISGAFMYLAVSFQGSIMSTMTVNRFIHFTQWTIGHSHLALFGAFGFIASAAMLWMVPQILRKPLWSRNLADAQFWFMLIGITGYFWDLTAAGLAQSSAWVSLGQQVVRAYVVLKPYFIIRSLFGGLIWIGAIMMAVNLIVTWIMPAPDESTRRRQLIADLEDTAATSLSAATVNGRPVTLHGNGH